MEDKQIMKLNTSNAQTAVTLDVDNEVPGPVDKHNICYYIFLLYGIGTLLPWNAVLTSSDFFDH